jgi:hypothetical protein
MPPNQAFHMPREFSPNPEGTPDSEGVQVFLKPMETFHCAPDDASFMGERIRGYFAGVVDILDYNERAKGAFLKIEYKTLHFEGEDAKLYPTDDKAEYLTAHGVMIAFILIKRTPLNYIDVVMGCTLTPELLAQFQSHKELLRKS